MVIWTSIIFIENTIKPANPSKSSISGLYKNINGGDVFDEENGTGKLRC